MAAGRGILLPALLIESDKFIFVASFQDFVGRWSALVYFAAVGAVGGAVGEEILLSFLLLCILLSVLNILDLIIVIHTCIYDLKPSRLVMGLSLRWNMILLLLILIFPLRRSIICQGFWLVIIDFASRSWVSVVALGLASPPFLVVGRIFVFI